MGNASLGCGETDDEDACLIEKAHGSGDDEHGKHVGCGCDDGRQAEDDDYGMLAVAAHEVGGDKVELGEEPCQHRHFEHDAEGERHCYERRHIAVEGDHIDDGAANLVRSEEAEGQWEYEEIAYEHAESEHHVSSASHTDDVMALVGIESRRDEAEQLIDDVRRST